MPTPQELPRDFWLERDEALDDAKFAERIAAKREADAVADRETAEASLAEALKVLENEQSEQSERFRRAGEHLHRRAREFGWKDDGEGAFEFVARIHYEAGLRDAAKGVAP